jgi:hypothetical protein
VAYRDELEAAQARAEALAQDNDQLRERAEAAELTAAQPTAPTPREPAEDLSVVVLSLTAYRVCAMVSLALIVGGVLIGVAAIFAPSVVAGIAGLSMVVCGGILARALPALDGND